jgi:tol-pal system protein YbgF
MYLRVILGLIAAAAILTGCATTGSSDSVANTVYATHNSVKKLEKDLGGSIEQLNTTAVDLTTRVEESDRQSRELKSSLEVVELNVARVESKLDSLTATLYKYLNLTPSTGPDSMSPDMPKVDVETPGAAASGESGEGGQLSDASPGLAATPPAAGPADADVLYGQAQEEFKRQNYEAAFGHFDAYLQRYPNADAANKAQFWKGECCLRQGKYNEAIAEFEELRRDYKMSSYVPISLHNQAHAHLKLGQQDQAVNLLKELVENYPMSPAAERARASLAKLQP